MLKLLIHSICLVLCSMNIWAEANTNQLSVRVGSGQAIEFIWIKPGQFVMGAPASDMLAEAEEKPQRIVQIEHGFYLGRTTVTVGQFRQFVLETGYKTDAETDQRPRYQGGHGYNATSTFPFDDGYPFTAPVGSFKPNPWGLYDMIGNVFQWCADEIPESPPQRVLRGGCYNQNIELCRCAARGFGKTWSRYSYTGIRVALTP